MVLFAQRVSRVLKNKHWNPTGIVKILSSTYLSYYVIVRLITIFLNYIGVRKSINFHSVIINKKGLHRSVHSWIRKDGRPLGIQFLAARTKNMNLHNLIGAKAEILNENDKNQSNDLWVRISRFRVASLFFLLDYNFSFKRWRFARLADLIPFNGKQSLFQRFRRFRVCVRVYFSSWITNLFPSDVVFKGYLPLSCPT